MLSTVVTVLFGLLTDDHFKLTKLKAPGVRKGVGGSLHQRLSTCTHPGWVGRGGEGDVRLGTNFCFERAFTTAPKTCNFVLFLFSLPFLPIVQVVQQDGRHSSIQREPSWQVRHTHSHTRHVTFVAVGKYSMFSVTLRVGYLGGVVLGSDTRATAGAIVALKNCFKLESLADNIMCAGAGTAADCSAVRR